MTSDKNDDLDLEMDMGRDDNEQDNIIDVEGIDEPLSASPFSASAASDFDSGEDEHDDDDFDREEDAPPPRKKSGGMSKVVAPLLVLLAAGAAGGYIVMNPGILGGGATPQVQTNPQPPVADTAMLPPPDLTPLPADAPPAMEVAAGEIPPQPLATLNEAPAGAPVEGSPEAPVAPDATLDQPVPEILPEVAAAEQAAPVDAPVEATVDAPVDANAPVQDTAQVLAGSDVAVAPETMQVPADAPAPAADTTAPATPEVVPEVAPEIAPEIAQAPAPDAAAPVTPPAAPVTEPTFVPAPPETTSSAPVEVQNPAAPPVMNAQEFAPATPNPVTNPGVPSVNSNAVAAASGQAAAPAAPGVPQPASNVYYDSLGQVPTGPMATSVGPREINPVMEPASRMVVVSKDKGEGTEAALLVAANRALKLQRYDAALEMYDQLYAKNKRDARILMGRAVAQQNMGLNESAIQSYEEVLDLKPDNAEALVNMMGLVRKQYPEVALRRLLDMYARHPNNAGIAAQIGITNAGLGHFDDAMRYLGIASTLEPRNAQHLFNMAVAADRQGNKSMAIQLYERALETDVMYGASRSVPRESIYDRLSALRRG